MIAVVSSKLDSCLCILMKKTKKWKAKGLMQETIYERQMYVSYLHEYVTITFTMQWHRGYNVTS